MHRGYIKLWRKIQDNKFWNERRKFSKAEAWIDILMEARHNPEPCEVMFGMTSVECCQGQCVKSTRTWGARWGWSEHKVRDFLRLLRDSRAITTKTGAKWTQITVLNYSQYQEDGRKLDARRAHDGRTTGDKQECKECKNEKNLKAMSKNSSQMEHCASDDAPLTEPDFLITRKKRKLNGKRYKAFMQFWEAFNYKKGRAAAADAWLDIPQMTEWLVGIIVEAATREARDREALIRDGRIPKMAQGWISERRWEDEPSEEKRRIYDTGRF